METEKEKGRGTTNTITRITTARSRADGTANTKAISLPGCQERSFASGTAKTTRRARNASSRPAETHPARAPGSGSSPCSAPAGMRARLDWRQHRAPQSPHQPGRRRRTLRLTATPRVRNNPLSVCIHNVCVSFCASKLLRCVQNLATIDQFCSHGAGVAEWQTQRTQNPPGSRP